MNSQSPTVSVIINCHNGQQYLREAMDSVYAQTVQDWEIVFWDDMSTDRSAEIAQSYDERVKYFKADRKLPLYAGRNRAVARARGRMIAFLDTDDLWLPNKLALQMPLLDSSERAGLVYSNVEIIDHRGDIRRWYSRRQPSGDIFASLLRRYHVVLATVMVTRAAAEAAGMFDESMTVSGDADLFLRICHDWEALYCPAVTARYREHGESLTATRPELFLREGDEILRKLSDRDPGFLTEYAHELVGFRATRYKAYVFGLWRAGDNNRARSLAWRYVRSTSSMVALWLLSFVPYSMVGPLRSSGGYAWWRWLTGR